MREREDVRGVERERKEERRWRDGDDGSREVVEVILIVGVVILPTTG